MLLSCFMFATMGACVKLVAPFFNAGQTVLTRGLIPVVLIGGWMLWQGASLRTPHWRSHLARSAAGATSMIMFFAAISLLPLAAAVTLNNTSALIMAGLFAFRQRPPAYLVFGLVLGLVGVAMLLQPSFSSSQWVGVLLGVCSAFLSSVALLNLRDLARAGEPEWRTVLILSMMMSTLSFPVSLSMPSNAAAAGLNEWSLLLAVGICGGVGQLSLTRAYRYGRTLVTASLGYATVVFSSLYGVFVWGEHLSPAAWAGIVAIVIAGLITTWQPQRKK
ncbi:MAG: hypothetical protein BSR46_03900 [Candidatus Dactylopiibacterium carminicum]|nr:MAG: hypothetical protein BSR46_03900 [Candidatus Dactylopiibacterium carminicum]